MGLALLHKSIIAEENLYLVNKSITKTSKSKPKKIALQIKRHKQVTMVENLPLDRHAMKDKSTSHLRIYVGNIGDKVTDIDLFEHFKAYGQITGIVVNRNFGFVQFEEEASAQAAIAKANGVSIQGKNINVRTAQTNQIRIESVQLKNDLPPAVALTDKIPAEEGDDQYDSYGNYVGDNNYRDDEYEGWNEGSNGRGAGPRGGRGMPRGVRGRVVRGRGAPGFRDRSPAGRGGEWTERGGYDRFSQPDYPRALPVPERNDCEIIVVSKLLTEYAEYIEGRLKRLGIVVDLLFPMEDVPIGKVLGNIASRGCLYAILVMPQNQEHRSLTLTILHGLPQEHRNMPLEDALQLLSRNFQEVQRGGPSGREAVYALLGQLADGRTLTVLQYDKVMEYLTERREQQVKLELGEPLTPTPVANKAQAELQQRILSILNEKKIIDPTPAPLPLPVPVAPQPSQQNKLLNDPTVRKALDSILQKFA